MHRTIFIIMLILCSSQSSRIWGQVITESGTHIFWQPDRKLTANDFQGEPKSKDIKHCKEKGACIVPCLGLYLEVDIPKNYRRNKFEMVYFAPAFQKSCSTIMSETKDVSEGQLFFDIMEVSSRIGRKLLKGYHDHISISIDSLNLEILINNPDTLLTSRVGSTLALHARDAAKSFYNELSTSYYLDMYSSTESHGFDNWRKLVDDLLLKYEEYATKPEECYRMVEDKPLEKKYKTMYKKRK
ncbi:hypothetical protein [Flammeovirga sp. EKP202]|uniref:hypothetical protein n=1 Tax=Flammeovirga sp. EKP202 TaxID=2770592 RepID=UPI00165F92A6|nr:hypothetical protein [Flammeovirga sp. EKP202]MBD0405316.1 hypothetical protein [Flammeovirga sp. EKP202]